jgi:hypothetical protein
VYLPAHPFQRFPATRTAHRQLALAADTCEGKITGCDKTGCTRKLVPIRCFTLEFLQLAVNPDNTQPTVRTGPDLTTSSWTHGAASTDHCAVCVANLCLLSITPQQIREWRYSSAHSPPRHCVQMSGQLHASFALPPVSMPWRTDKLRTCVSNRTAITRPSRPSAGHCTD